MYKRTNSSASNGAISSNANTAFAGRAGGYRPTYPLPPSYASGMPSTIASTERKKKSQFNRGGSSSGILKWAGYIVIGILLIGLLVSRIQVNSARNKLEKFQKTVTRDEDNFRKRDERKGGRGNQNGDSKELSRKLEKLERSLEVSRKSEFDFQSKVENVEKEKSGLVEEISHLKKSTEAAGKGEKELKKYDKREKVLYSRVEALIEKIKRESQRELRDQFLSPNSAGGYFVKFNLRIPDVGLESFFIETATIDEMPHSVHLFLEQVKNQLWNGCTFIINAPHILQAGPHTADTTVDRFDSFKKLELDSVSFQEYSDTFPHNKYTLGFAGRPGGPDFYINKNDNKKTHGPGGQMQQILEEEADPCFAKVIDGFKVVDHLFNLPTEGKHDLLAKPVEIVSVLILDASYVPPAGGAKANTGTSENNPAKELNLEGAVKGQMM